MRTDISDKSKISHIEYRLGSKELELLRRLIALGFTTFSVTDVSRILDTNRNNLYQILHRLENKGIVKGLRGGKYVIQYLPGYETADVLAIASNIYWPSYISFWTALMFYKFTEQLPRTVYVVTPIQRLRTSYGDTKIRFVKLSEKRVFGYERIGKIFIASKEKAILDSLLHPNYAGGIKEAFKCLVNAWPQLDEDKFIVYAAKLDSMALLQRLGYLIELAKLPVRAITIDYLAEKVARQSYKKLDPSLPQKGELNSKWRLYVNMSRKDLYSWEEII